jgi:uncharacterized membrane protein YheB (UPF0754 family)
VSSRLLLLAALSVPLLLRAEIPPGIAATVNGKSITSAELDRQTRALISTDRHPELSVSEVRDRALKNLIDRELLLQAFYKEGGKIPDGEIDRRLSDIIKHEFGDDRAQFEETLRERGISVETYRQEIADNFIIAYLRTNHSADSISSLQKGARIEIYSR